MYRMITDLAGLQQYLAYIGDRSCALDFETTSLRPLDGRVRLVSLYDGVEGAVVDFDAITGGFEGCALLFHQGEWIVFNSGFELRWFIAAGAPDTNCRDVGFLRRAIVGGGQFSLKMVVKWDLDREMDKTEQASNWGDRYLTQSQLDYAYKDAVDTWDLYQHWLDQADENHLRAWRMFDDMVPAVIEMEDTGMLVDIPRHRLMTVRWDRAQDRLCSKVREVVSTDDVANINSDAQWSDFFLKHLPDQVVTTWPRTEKSNLLSMQSKVLNNIAGQFAQAAGENPLTTLLDCLRDYKRITKYITSFGEPLITSASKHGDSRVRCRFNIGAAKTCRFSSSGPNLQQIPRDLKLLGEDTSVRASFVAPHGSVLVSLDYSGIELRVLALLADDHQLLEDVVYGDVHSEVAAVIAGKAIDKSTPEGKAARTAAKGVSFGIIYGSAAAGLAVNMRTSSNKAQKYIDFWADRYPRAFAYRSKIMAMVADTGYIRCVDGGTIKMDKRKIDLPKCANYPVQRAALSVMAHAIARHKRSLDAARARGEHTRTKLLSTIHDALIDEALREDAQSCLEMMQQNMIDGYLDLFPGAPSERLVEGGIGRSWATLE